MTITTPDAALAAVAATRTAAQAVVTAGDACDLATLTALGRAARDLDAIHPAAPDAEEWADVDAAFDGLVAWLGEPADTGTKAALTRDEQIKLAAAVLGRGSGRRRGDPAEFIISTFEAGLVGTVKLAWAAVKLTARVGIAAGILAGRGIALAATAAADGLVRVQGYMRADGTQVDSYERSTPKAMSQLSHMRAFAVKLAAGAPDGTIEGYGSIFNVVDSYSDIVVKGAFLDSLGRLKAEGRGVKMLWQHDQGCPIGVWDEVREDDRGLYCKGRLLLDVDKAREAYALMKAGAIDGLSIGYECRKWTHCMPDEVEGRIGAKYWAGPMGMGGQIRLIEQCDLWEISVVTFPACTPATVDAVKAARQIDLSAVAAALDRRASAIRSAA